MRSLLSLLLLVAATGCGDDAPEAPDTVDLGAGSGDVDGGGGTVPFDGVRAALWIGAPDARDTTVVYLFSRAVSCSMLGSTGWDARIEPGTQLIELKMVGSAAGSFHVVRSPTPAPGEAAAYYTQAGPAPTERIADDGTVSLRELNAGVSAAGHFDVGFGAEALIGDFAAAFCPGGREP